MKKKVVLIGFPGAGKTTVGRTLREQYSWSWVDVDEVVEAEAGCSITDVIREEGENVFRSLEREAVKAALAGDNDVVSLGGGALLHPETKQEVGESCLLIHLSVSEAQSAKRVLLDEAAAKADGRNAKRPLLVSGDEVDAEAVKEKLSSLMESRRGLYDLADYTLETNKKTPEDLAREIVKLVEEQSS